MVIIVTFVNLNSDTGNLKKEKEETSKFFKVLFLLKTKEFVQSRI
jgi:hypothetical protein